MSNKRVFYVSYSYKLVVDNCGSKQQSEIRPGFHNATQRKKLLSFRQDESVRIYNPFLLTNPIIMVGFGAYCTQRPPSKIRRTKTCHVSASRFYNVGNYHSCKAPPQLFSMHSFLYDTVFELFQFTTFIRAGILLKGIYLTTHQTPLHQTP